MFKIDKDKKIKIEYFFSSLPILWIFTGHLWLSDNSKTLVAITLLFLVSSIFFSNLCTIKNNIKSRKFLWVIFCIAIYGMISKEIHGYSNKEIRVLLSVALYFSIVNDRFIRLVLERIHWLLLLSSATTLCYSVYQTYFLEVDRGLWPLNPIPLTTVSAGAAVCALAYLLKTKLTTEKIVLSATFLLSLSAILVSETRGSLLALLSGSILIILMHLKEQKIRFKTVLSAIIVVLSVGFILKDSILSRYYLTMEEIRNISDGNLDTSIGFRFQLWESALHTPISLLGLGDKHIAFREALYNENIISQSAVYWDHYHNQFISSLYIHGIIGLIGLLFILITPLILLRNNKNKEVLFSLIPVYFITSLTDIPFNQSISLGFYLAMVLIALASNSKEFATKIGQQYDE
ncbi:O-antigen ligase family protein [Vibrio vulnificus]|nr:O-antigen ligase family protein [Vibrio vulnificus]